MKRNRLFQIAALLGVLFLSLPDIVALDRLWGITSRITGWFIVLLSAAYWRFGNPELMGQSITEKLKSKRMISDCSILIISFLTILLLFSNFKPGSSFILLAIIPLLAILIAAFDGIHFLFRDP
jgi:hypothetical protein